VGPGWTTAYYTTTLNQHVFVTLSKTGSLHQHEYRKRLILQALNRIICHVECKAKEQCLIKDGRQSLSMQQRYEITYREKAESSF
jgi:hypothetical protein